MRGHNKSFWTTLLFKQNRYHKYGILLHTLAVTSHTLKNKEYKMIPAAILHDIGKAYVSYHDSDDIKGGCKEYSFKNHEEVGYRIIKDWPTWLVSDYTKDLIRYHYLIRAIGKEKIRNPRKYRRLKRTWDRLDIGFRDDLKRFLVYDDLGKKGF